jgi:nondiscriminating glutamyl-tRNA synthetase
MHQTAIKTRFAPSPTGYLHLGNARTALFNNLLARHGGGVFLLRIEDTDRERSRPEYLQALLEDLAWLGLAWQEGHPGGGDHGPYRQSERGATYRQHFDTLLDAGLAYPCFCTPEQLALSRKTQRAAGHPPRYAGTCARLSREAAVARLDAGEPATLRFRVPAGETVAFEDLVRGPQRFASGDIGDFVIRRADGSPAFFFSNAVDDALMGVTHVLRGEDHLSNTPRQLLILQVLGLRTPRYGHISLILGEDGAPLSKRQGSTSVRDLQETGYLPGAVLNYLARLGHAYPEPTLLGLDELAAGFAIGRLASAPARFDGAQLRYWQHAAMRALPTAALWSRLPEDARALVPEASRDAFVEVMRENIQFPAEGERWARRLFGEGEGAEPEVMAVMGNAGEEFYRSALRALDTAPEDFKAFADRVRAATGARGKGLFQPLRAALTGALDGPELRRVYALLGPARVRRRLEAALAHSHVA